MKENGMTKKGLLVLVLVGTFAGSAFAQMVDFRLGLGAGGFYLDDFGGGIEEPGGEQTSVMKTPYVGRGGFVFFDATYAEVSAGFFVGSATLKENKEGERQPSEVLSYIGLDLGLFGKFPIGVNYILSVYPLLGASYRLILSATRPDGTEYETEDEHDAKDFNAIWFHLGGGMDVSFTDYIFMRMEVLYGVRLPNTAENDLLAEKPDSKILFGHGPMVKMALGVKF
jgi:hypothetical protein